MNIGRFVGILGAGGAWLVGTSEGGGTAADTFVNSAMSVITTACGAAMLKRASRYGKPCIGGRITERIHVAR